MMLGSRVWMGRVDLAKAFCVVALICLSSCFELGVLCDNVGYAVHLER